MKKYLRYFIIFLAGVFLVFLLTRLRESQDERAFRFTHKQYLVAVDAIEKVNDFIDKTYHTPVQDPIIKFHVQAYSYYGEETSLDMLKKRMNLQRTDDKGRLCVWWEGDDAFQERWGSGPYKNAVLVELCAPSYIYDYPDQERQFREAYEYILNHFPYESLSYPVFFYIYCGPIPGVAV